jgi:hypothetical protein
MKKLLLLILTVAFAVSCFASCSYFGSGSGSNDSLSAEKIFFVSPEDEESAVCTVTQTDENGMKLEITLHGYKSESLGKEFYVKNNEFFLADIKLTNESDTTFYKFLPTSCRDCTPAHNHEIDFDIANGENKLHSSSFGFTCAEMTDLLKIEPGQSYEWQLKMAAAKPQSDVVYKPGENDGKNDADKEDLKENTKDKKEGEETKNVSDNYIYYESNFIQGGNVQIYESVYTNGSGNIIFGTDYFVTGDGALSSSYHFVINGIFTSITGVLPSDGNESDKLFLYGEALFPENTLTFDGSFFFSYMKESDGYENNISVSVPVSVEVVYVSPKPHVEIEK